MRGEIMSVQELVKNLEKASKELLDLEAIKKSVNSDIESLMLKRIEIEEKNKLLQKAFDDKQKAISIAQSDFDRRIDNKNLIASQKELEIKKRDEELIKKELNFKNKEKIVSDKSKLVEDFMINYKEGLLGKSEEFKKLAEKLKA